MPKRVTEKAKDAQIEPSPPLWGSVGEGGRQSRPQPLSEGPIGCHEPSSDTSELHVADAPMSTSGAA
jgi:hypothetical protein